MALDRVRGMADPVVVPLGAALARTGVRPDVLTWCGTVWVVVVSVVCFPQGWLWQGAIAVALVAPLDMLDGEVARRTGRTSPEGAFLDSTLDRVADGAVLGGLAVFLAGTGPRGWVGVAVWALVAGQVTSYARARAEALDLPAARGLVTRTDRLVIALGGAALNGAGVPYALETALLVLAVTGTWTVAQRVLGATSRR
ncbi:CDP-alcohol phosphatidyltransferase family protein [Mariniluteicoccus endophyticus]